ncbi:MAG: hypothetical protein ACTSUO_00690 [Candidatus Thorarchaeota archaeon]
MTSIIKNRSLLAFSTIAVIALGFGLPSVLIYLNVFHGLDIWFVGFFTLLSLAGGISAPAIMMEATQEGQPKVSTDKEIERFRETQIDLLKDLDEISDYLGEIRDRLRVEE